MTDTGITDPDALLYRAVRSQEAKRTLGVFFRCSWEYIDANLPEILLEAVRRLPEQGGLRHDQDRLVARSIASLLADLPRTDPRRRQIQQELSGRLRNE